MTDKEKIIQWFSDIAEMCSKLTTGNVSHLGATIKGKAIRAAEYIEKHSLPKEPASEDLDFLVISLEETIGTSPHSREVIKEHLQKTAEWGRNHFEDRSEMVSEDLDKEIGYYTTSKLLGKRNHSTGVYHLTQKECDNIARHFAEWQKQKDQETIELAEDHAMLAGMNKMKEEMMKDAVDAFVHQGLYSKYVKECDDEALANVLKNYNSGDKVKIIIVKTKQQ